MKVWVLACYGPSEGYSEEKDRFRNDMDRTPGRVGNGYRMCILENLNGWKRDWTRAGIIYAF